jgi:catechol 2,3-dioxygenase-like lactoylglutathione lyase family enzyme
VQPFELRKLGHVVLNVTDLDASVRFYTEVLGLQVSDRYPTTMVPGGMVFMRVNPDHHGIALVGGASKPEKTGGPPSPVEHGGPATGGPPSPVEHGGPATGGPPNPLNHFAFEVGSPDEVFRARAWLRKNGVPIVFEGRRRAGCQLAVEFRDPDGNNLEIYWGIDQVGTDGSVRPPSEWRQALTLEDAVANPVNGQRMPPLAGG